MERNDAVENAFLWRQPTRWAQLLAILFLIAACAGSAFSQTTVFNGVVKDLTLTPVSAGQVSFTLRPGIETVISGNARFTSTTVFCEIHYPTVVSTSGTGTITVVVGTAETWQVGDSILFVGTGDVTLNANTVATPYVITGVNSPTSYNFSQSGTHTNGPGGMVGGLYKSGGTGACAVMQNSALTPGNTSYNVALAPNFSPTTSFNTYAIGSGPIDISTIVPTPGQQPAYSFVDLFSNQTITGVKTFTQPIVGNINGNAATATTANTATTAATATLALGCKTFENIQCVDATLSRGGSDIGAEMNLAIAACPAAPSVCSVWLMPNPTGTPYNYSTTIAWTTKGKYPVWRNFGSCVPVAITGLSGGGCLNYTGSGDAIQLDYYDTTASNVPTQIGLYGIGVIANNCTTTNGCGGSAVGIHVLNVNGGNGFAEMQNVSIVGFGGKGYINTNPFAAVIHWINPFFEGNAIAMQHGNITERFDGGVFAGNGCIEQTAASMTPELYFNNTNTFTNTGGSCAAAFDYTLTGTNAGMLHLNNVHLENSSVANAHYISGNVYVIRNGGAMEDDNSTGTGDWMVQLSSLGMIHSNAIVLSPRAYTNVYLFNSGTRGEINDINASPGVLTNAMFTGGTSAVHVTTRIQPVGTATAAYPWALESPLSFIETGLTPSAVAGQDVCFGGNPGLRCSYNNGVFEPLIGPSGAPGITVAALPAAASNPGAVVYVTDSSSIAAEGQTCVGGSGTKALAFSSGSIWKCF